MVQHNQRSVLENNYDKLILRAERFIHYVLKDLNNQRVYGREIQKTVASVMTYVALHLALLNAPKLMIWQYMVRGVSFNIGELFRRRFLVILKLMAGV
jgi:hypothetical protein